MENYINKVIQGDCLIKLKELDDNSIDSIVTDPPYELGFMGKSWDNTGIANNKEMWSECLRVLKPGGHLLAFSGTRTYHRMASAIEDAGFEVRDMIEWVYGSGFPKSLNIGKAMDGVLGKQASGFNTAGGKDNFDKQDKSFRSDYGYKYEPQSDNAKEWEGWGTALKPAHEPICMARKPLDRWWKIKDDGKKVIGRIMTVAENCLKWGTGGINIDESRVESNEDMSNIKAFGTMPENKSDNKGFSRPWMNDKQSILDKQNEAINKMKSMGRFPANIILEDCEEVRECFPETKSGKAIVGTGKGFAENASGISSTGIITSCFADSGNASRYFKSIIYQAKASKSERNKNTNNYLIIEICVDNTEVAQLQPKVILEKTELWFTELFGKEKMEEYQMDFKSTIKTETKKTTILVILNYSQHLNIKEYIVGAIKTKTENGGSHVASVANISEWRAIITDELMAYLLGVNPVVSPTQLRISVNTNNFHSTVKPTALMSYLIKMITPKGGIVLDPFAGSGSTLVAAKQNGFQYIGIELTEEYIPIIEARLSGVENDLFKDIL